MRFQNFDAHFVLLKDARQKHALITSNEFVPVPRVENEQRRLSYITHPLVVVHAHH